MGNVAEYLLYAMELGTLLFYHEGACETRKNYFFHNLLANGLMMGIVFALRSLFALGIQRVECESEFGLVSIG